MITSRLDRPVASIVFDDFAQNAWTVGGRILEAAGARGTYFVAGSYCGREADGVRYFGPDDLVAAHGSGHEIGCHTFDHRTVSGRPASEIETSLERNQDFVRGLIGETSNSTKLLLGGHFAACRDIFPGINTGRFRDAMALSAHPAAAPRRPRAPWRQFPEQECRCPT
jgi:peptidoglycan/xylan/chitin deacetylase (PgdA/CDA1 family)